MIFTAKGKKKHIQNQRQTNTSHTPTKIIPKSVACPLKEAFKAHHKNPLTLIGAPLRLETLSGKISFLEVNPLPRHLLTGVTPSPQYSWFMYTFHSSSLSCKMDLLSSQEDYVFIGVRLPVCLSVRMSVCLLAR